MSERFICSFEKTYSIDPVDILASTKVQFCIMRGFFLFHLLAVLKENMIGSLFFVEPELFTLQTYFDKVLHKVVPMVDYFMMQVPSNV